MKMRVLEKFWRSNMSKIEYNDLIGKTFGFLTIKEITKNKAPYKQAICKCLCGNTCTRGVCDLIKAKNKIGSRRAQCGQCYNGIPLKKFIGEKYGYLTIIDFVKDIKPLKAICKCSCGNKCERLFTNLQRNSRKHKKLLSQCGECFQGIPLKNFIGKKYGGLTILDVKKKTTPPFRKFFMCKCVCGNIVERRIESLVNSKTGGTCEECYKGISLKDYIGKTYGYLTVKKIYRSNDGKSRTMATCRCSCGNVFNRPLNKIINSKGGTCGKCYLGKKYNDFIGKRFGHLVIKRIVKENSITKAVCLCDCGNEYKGGLCSVLKMKEESSCGKCYNGISCKSFIEKKYGYWTILSLNRSGYRSGLYAKCQCKCSKSKIRNIRFTEIINGRSLSCGCLKHKIKPLQKLLFGKLKILSTSKNNVGGLRYICKCTCGNEVEVLESDLFTGKVTCCKECLDLN